MATVSMDTVSRWWQATRDYSWESLRSSLYQIAKENTVSQELYQDLRWAVNKLESLGVDFPKSASELYQRLDFYL
jgi:hypothetical protein